MSLGVSVAQSIYAGHAAGLVSEARQFKTSEKLYGSPKDKNKYEYKIELCKIATTTRKKC